MRIDLIAVGKLRGAEAALFDDYARRLKANLRVTEIDAGKAGKSSLMDKEAKKILKACPEKSFVVALDERGKDLSSAELAEKYASWMQRAGGHVAFVIGGADGLAESVRKRADFMLSLGRKTWPHLLARVMLVEQIYRAQQILAGHPYHRA